MKVLRQVLVAGFVVVTACSVSPTPPSFPTAGTTPSIAASPTPVPTVAPIGPTDANGIPTTLAGRPVLRGVDPLAAIAAREDATPFLAGGWFHDDIGVRYCSAYFGDWVVGPCPGLELFADRVDAEPFLSLANSGSRFIEIEMAATRAVVLVVHTHDKRCAATDVECTGRAVGDAVAWLGEIPADSPPPRLVSTPPPNGMTRTEAIDRATARADPHASPLEVRIAVAGPYWTVLPMWGRSSNQWVWVVVLDGDFMTPCIEPCSDKGDSELLVLDYVTGDLLGTMTPAGPPENLPTESQQ